MPNRPLSLSPRPCSSLVIFVLTLTAAASGCNSTVELPARAPGTRAPLTADCDPSATLRCLLPFPSNRYTVADPSTETGLRLAIQKTGLTVRDDVDVINRADGFSRGTPLLVGFDTEITDADGAIHLVQAQPGDGFGAELGVWTAITTDAGASLINANPYTPLAPNTDYVVAVTRDLVTAGGDLPAPERITQLALDLVEPDDDDERAIVAYNAPIRMALERAGIDFEDVLVVWDFTTRSRDDHAHEYRAMLAQTRAAVAQGEVSVRVDGASIPADDSGAVAVVGTLSGLPLYLLEDGALAPYTPGDDGSDGEVEIVGTTSAPFRVLIPSGEDDYPVVLYGHGTGGSFDDDTLDGEVTGAGVAKVGVEFRGWTGTSVAETWLSWEALFRGVHRSTAGLMQSHADIAGIQDALSTVIGDMLAAESWTFTDPDTGEEVTFDNPAAGRRPDGGLPTWTGGSLGGTMGLTYVSAHPDMLYGVLNVPGCGWTQWIHDAMSFGTLKLLFTDIYGGLLDFMLHVKMVQTLFDPIDGVAWTDALLAKDAVVLIQESVGDPVLPNPGSRLVATSAGAVQIGGVIEPWEGIPPGTSPSSQSAYTQFNAPDDWEGLTRHGFAGRDGEVGEAAREQIRAYLGSILDRNPTITLPSLCAERDGVCDFADR